MRIALVGTGLLSIPPVGYGAVERHIGELYDHLRARGEDAVIVNRVVRSEYAFIPMAIRLLHRLQPDLVHVHRAATGVALATLFDSVVFTSHNPSWAAAELALRDRFGLALEKIVARRASAFIALNPTIHAKVSEVSARSYLVYGAIDPSKWHVSALEGGYALSVGMIDRRKGYHKLAEVRGNIPYVVAGKSVGDRAYEARLRTVGVELRANPTNEELARLYSDASVYVHPSDFDAFSLAVLEAMASGLPIVASPMCREQVLTGVNGFLVEDEDYAKPVRSLLRDARLRKRMGGASRRLAEERFSWDVIIDRIIEVYEAVL